MRTFKVMEELAAQTDIRLQLLANGYRPLPTAAKVAFMKGWPDMIVDERKIADWPLFGPNSQPATTTAIQLRGNMLAIDVDVTDADVSDQVYDLMCTHFGDGMMSRVMVRDSGSAKFMIMVRTERPYNMWKTAKFADKDGNENMVEVYGGASTRYFSCFGAHTLGGIKKGSYEVVKDYRWLDDHSPLRVKPDDLELITKDKLDAFLLACSDLLEGVKHFEKMLNTHAGEYEASVAYDLHDDMIFDTVDGSMDYGEAVYFAMDNNEARCSASFIREDSGNVSKCRMSAVGTDEEPELLVFDHETWTTHYPKSWAPKTTKERTALSTKLAARFAELDLSEYEQDGAVDEDFEATVEYLMENYVYCEKTESYHRFGGEPFTRIKGAAIKNTYNMRHHYVTEGANGQTYDKVTTAGAVFMAQEGKMKAWYPRYDPREEPRSLFEKDGVTYMNAWSGVPDLGEAAPKWVDMMANNFLPHLIPNKDEREWFLDWLATKYAKPWLRMGSVLFLAEGESGTGRGAFFSIVSDVFGDVQTLGERTLFGDQFNSWAVSNTMILCNELGQSSQWSAAEEAYAKFKELSDPTNNEVSIRHMGVSAEKAETFTSFIVATNKATGMRMDYEDRRLAVITNGRPLTEASWADALMDEKRTNGTKAMAAALAAILRDRVVTTSQKDLDVPPHFAGWYNMVKKGEGTIARVFRDIVEEHDGTFKVWKKSEFKREVWKLAKDDLPRGATTTTVLREIETLVGSHADELGLYLTSGKVEQGGKGNQEVVTNKRDQFLTSTVDERNAALSGADTRRGVHKIASKISHLKAVE